MRPLMLVGLLALVGCGKPTPPNPQQNCSEFPYVTKHGDVLVNCKMLWCTMGFRDTNRSGMATLFCDELEKK